MRTNDGGVSLRKQERRKNAHFIPFQPTTISIHAGKKPFFTWPPDWFQSNPTQTSLHFSVTRSSHPSLTLSLFPVPSHHYQLINARTHINIYLFYSLSLCWIEDAPNWKYLVVLDGRWERARQEEERKIYLAWAVNKTLKKHVQPVSFPKFRYK